MASRLRGPLISTARALALAGAVMLVTAVATGWLYWVRAGVAHWPGPMARDALPLDELPGHDRVPLVIYVAAFGLAGAALGLVARALRLSRLAAGLSLAAGVGAWLFVVDAVSEYIVRQDAFSAAFHAAAGLQTLYLAAALAGVGGALLGRDAPRGRANRATPLLAWMVAAGGLIDLIFALFPRPRGHWACWSASGLALSTRRCTPCSCRSARCC